MRASLAILDIAPDRVTVPLIGATYRAVLGGADFSLHLSGFTGSGKSELAALAQQHFGAEMTARNLPGAWSSTANQLEGLAFSAKDALLTIDDYVPQGSAVDRARQNATADRVLRGVGNAAGRGRAGPDGRPRPARPPRALVLSTGEDIPGGQSLRARTLIIEVAKGDIGGGDLRTLTAHQKAAEAGQYAMAMAGFIQWLAADFDAKRHKFEAGAKARRHELAAAASHARTADIAAQLATAWRVIAAFAVDMPRHQRGRTAGLSPAGRRRAGADHLRAVRYSKPERPHRAVPRAHQWRGRLRPGLHRRPRWRRTRFAPGHGLATSRPRLAAAGQMHRLGGRRGRPLSGAGSLIRRRPGHGQCIRRGDRRRQRHVAQTPA